MTEIKLTSGKPSRKDKAIAEVTSEKGKKRFNVELPVDLHRKVKIYCASNDIKMNELAVKLFNELLSKNS